MNHQYLTANQAQAEYVAKCNEIQTIQTAKRYVEGLLSEVVQGGPLVTFHTVGDTMYATDNISMLLEMYADAEDKLIAVKSARDSAYAVWQLASADLRHG